MKAQDYLECILEMERGIEDMKLERLAFREGIEDVVITGKLFYTILDYEMEVDKAISNVPIIKSEVIVLIGGLTDENHRRVLKSRYIYGKSWDNIADEMHYSKRRVYEFHKEALEEFGKIYNKP